MSFIDEMHGSISLCVSLCVHAFVYKTNMQVGILGNSGCPGFLLWKNKDAVIYITKKLMKKNIIYSTVL